MKPFRINKARRFLFSFLLATGGLLAPAHAVLKTWNNFSGSGDGFFGDGANWSPAGIPGSADDVLFNSTLSGVCRSTMPIAVNSITIASAYSPNTLGMEGVGISTITGAFTVAGATVQFRDGFGPFLLQGAVTVNGGGLYHIGQTTVTIALSSITVNSGGQFEMHDLGLLQSSSVYVGSGGALHLFDNSGGLTGPPTLTSTAAASFLKLTVDGTVDVSSGIFRQLDPSGFRIGSGATITNFSSVTFQGPLQPGATAINFYSGGSFVSTFTNVNFADPIMAINLNAAPLSAGSRLTLRTPSGPRAGASFTDDPGLFVSWIGTVSAVAVTPAANTNVGAGSAIVPGGQTFTGQVVDGLSSPILSTTTISLQVVGVSGATGTLMVNYGVGWVSAGASTQVISDGMGRIGISPLLAYFVSSKAGDAARVWAGPTTAPANLAPAIAAQKNISGQLVTVGGIPTNLAYISTPTAATVGITEIAGDGGAYTLQRLDDFGNVTVQGNTNVQLTVAETFAHAANGLVTGFLNSGDYGFRDSGNTTFIGSNISIPNGLSTVSFRYHDRMSSYSGASPSSNTFEGGRPGLWTIQAQIFPVSPIAAHLLRMDPDVANRVAGGNPLVPASFITEVAGQVRDSLGNLAALHAQIQDRFGNPVVTASSVTVSLSTMTRSSSLRNEFFGFSASSASTLGFRSSPPSFAASTTSVMIGINSYQTTFYYMDTTASPPPFLLPPTLPSFKLSAPGLASSTWSVTIFPDIIDGIAVSTGAGQTLAAGTTSQAFFLETRDFYGNPSALRAGQDDGTGAVSFQLASNSSGQVQFSTPTTGRFAPAPGKAYLALGQSATSFFLIDTLQSNPTFTLTVTGLTGASPSWQTAISSYIVSNTSPAASTITFSGNFAAPGGANVTGTNAFAFNAGVGVTVDTVTSGGPFYNMILLSSSSAQGMTNSPKATSLVRYDSNGNLVATVSLSNGGTPSHALDASGNIYLFNAVASGAKTIKKFSPALNLLSSLTLSDAVGGDAWLASDGAFLYAAHKGSGSDPAAKIVKYNSNLVQVATATYQIGSFQTTVLAVDADPSGNVNVLLSTGTFPGNGGETKHLVQYNNTLSGSSVAVDVTFLTGTWASMAAQGSTVFVVGSTLTTSAGAVVESFASGTLANTGVYAVQNATGSVLGFPFLRRSPDGFIILAGGVLKAGRQSYGAIKLDTSLNVISSVTFNGAGGGIDNPVGVAVLDANTVVLSGTSQNTGLTFDAVTVKLSLPVPVVNFTGTFTGPTGAVAANSSNFPSGEQDGKTVVDNITTGGPFYYTILQASLVPNVFTNYIVKYNASGVMLASATVSGTVKAKAIAVDLYGSVYSGWQDQTTNRLFLNKYGPSLSLSKTVEISSVAVGAPSLMTTQGNQLYVLYNGAAAGPAATVRYDLNLTALSTATAPATFNQGSSLDTDEVGNVYLGLASCFETCSFQIQKYDGPFSVLLASAAAGSGTTSQTPSLSAAGPYAYLARVTGSSLTVRQLSTATLSDTGAVSTFTFASAFTSPLVKATPDGNVYAAVLVNTNFAGTISPLSKLRAQTAGGPAFLAIRYNQGLHFLSSATFVSPSGSAQLVNGLAVANPATVVLSGYVNNTGAGKSDGVAVQLSLGPPAVVPAATCAPKTTTLSVSSIRWSLPNAFTNFPTSYNIYTAANPSVRAASVNTGSFDYTGLSTNTAYSVSFAGVNSAGQGPRSMAVTAYTLAAPPVGSAASVFATSATLSWQLNQNPVNTRAWVDKSTDSLFRVQSTTLAPVTSLTDSALQSCTSYYFRIRNLNGDGWPTAYDSTLAFMTAATTPTAPGAFTAASLPGNKIAFNWSPSGPEGISGYNLYYDGGTGVVPSTGSAPFAVLGPSATSFTSGVLASTAAYSFHLTATNRCGVEEAVGAYAAAASIIKPSAIRAAVASPQSGRGSLVAGGPGGSNALTVAASLVSGNPSKVLFQAKPSTASAWTDIGTSASFPFTVSWDITDPSFVGQSLNLRAVAFDAAGNPDAAPSAVTMSVVAPGTPGAAGEVNLGGVVTKTLTLDNSVENTIVTSAQGRLTSLTLPPGAVNAPNPTISVVSNPDPSSFVLPTGFDISAGIVTKISLGAGQTLLPGATASFTISYPDAGNRGIIDGTNLRADSVRLISNTGLPGAGWNQDIATSVDLNAHTITGYTPHFSFFAIAGVVQTTLDSVRVYPVPYKPNGTDPNEGRPYTGAINTGIVFDNLPAVVTIKIYTVSGTLVTQLTSNAGTGAIVWDAKNDGGKDVASGGYFAVISTPGFKPLIKRLAIIR